MNLLHDARKRKQRKKWNRLISIWMTAVMMILSVLAGSLVPRNAYASAAVSSAIDQTIDKWMIDETNGYIYATASDSMKLLFIRLADLQVTKSISYLSSPTDLAADNGKLYLPLAGTSQISVVDVGSQSVVSNVYTSNGNPYRIAVDGNSLYYVQQNNSSFVTYKDLSTNAETRIGAPTTANSINEPALAMDKPTHRLYAAQSGLSGGNVIAYDTQTNSITSNESTYNEGYGFSFPARVLIADGNDVFYAGRRFDKGNLAVIHGDYNPDLDGKTDVYYVNGSHVFTDSAVFDRDTYVQTAKLPYTTTLSLMDAAGNVYLFNPAARTIDKMTLSFAPTNTVTGSVNDNKLSLSGTVTKLVYSNQTGYLYAIVPTLNKLLTIDPLQFGIVAQADAGSKPTDITLSGGKLYMSLYGATKVAVTDDVYGGAPITTLDTAQNPRRLAVADGTIFYLPEFPGFSGDRSVYAMTSAGGASQKVQYDSAYNYYYMANLLADEANHALYIGETSSSPRYLYKMNTIPSAGKYANPLKSAALGLTGEALMKDGNELFYGDSRFDTGSLTQLNGSSLYSPEVIAVKGNYVITKTAVYDRSSAGKLFDLPYTADAGVILDNGSVLLYSSAKGGLFRYSSVDEIKIPRELATGVTFTDNDPATGSIQGSVTWTPPADTSYLTGYSLYFLDAQGQPIQLIARVDKTNNSYTINTMSVPSGAVRIGVYSYNQWAESVKSASVPIWDFSTFLPKSVAFLDTNPGKGQIHGLLTWAPAADETRFSSYAVYFVDNTGKKIGTGPYTTVSNKQTSYSLDIPATDVPANASTITIYSMTDSGEMSTWNAFVRIADNTLSAVPGVTSVTYGLNGIPTIPSYQDLNPAAGIINGQLSWTGLSTDTLGGTYKVYFLDASYKTVGSVAEVPIDVMNSYRVTLPSDTAVPAGALYFGVVRKSYSGAEDTNALIIPINDLGGTASPTPPESTTPGSDSSTPAQDPSSPPSNSNPASGDPGTAPASQPDSDNTVITTGSDGKTTVTLSINDQQLKDLIANLSSSQDGTVKLNVDSQGSTVQAVLPGAAVQQLLDANANAALRFNTPIAALTIPAADLQQSIQQSGLNAANVNVTISAAQADSEIRTKLDTLLSGTQVSVIAVPVEFRITITAVSGDRQYEISATTSYIAHTIILPVSVSSGSVQQLAGVMYDPIANTYYPVPTVFTQNPDGTLQASLYRQGNSIYTVVSNHTTFNDIPASHYAKSDIETLARKFVITGYDDHTFKTDKPITRAEFASLLIRAMGILPAKAAKSPFQDVRASDWYYNAVTTAAEAGLISGYEDGTFRPNQTVSRQEMAVMIYAALRKGGYDKQLSSGQKAAAIAGFPDSGEIAAWAKEAASYAGNTGIMNGTADGSFAGGAPADRAQSAVMLYRMMKTLHFIN